MESRTTPAAGVAWAIIFGVLALLGWSFMDQEGGLGLLGRVVGFAGCSLSIWSILFVLYLLKNR